MRVLSVSHRLCSWSLYKIRTNHQEIFHHAHFEKSQSEVTVKRVVFFGVFDAIDTMVLLISPE